MLYKNKSINQKNLWLGKVEGFVYLFMCLLLLITLLTSSVMAKHNIAPYSDIEGNTAQLGNGGLRKWHFYIAS